MFRVYRWGVNKTVFAWWYCKKCMPTKQAVLDRIDSDKCPFGIAYVDRF